MNTPKFSVVSIARNEAKTLPRMVSALKEFQARGGEIVVVDTGSSDKTATIARELGCIVYEEGPRFMRVLDIETAAKINEKFVVGNETPLVKGGDKLFDFASARNYAASKARKDFICMIDCDEYLTHIDLDALDKVLSTPDLGRIEFNFNYAHDAFGKPTISFKMSRFYHRLKHYWQPNCVVHEILTNLPDTEVGTQLYVGEEILLSDHYQNHETNRSGYLVGLAWDCYLHPDNDRNSHYLGRELMYKGRYKSAIQELNRHTAFMGWPAERAQSIIYIGDCYKEMGNEAEAIQCWHHAFLEDGIRREPLMRLAQHFFSKGDRHKTAAYAAAALALPWTGLFYGDNISHYQQDPHEMLYWSMWYLGDKEKSEFHWRKAIGYQPLNRKYLNDAQFYIKPDLTLDSFKQAIKTRQPFSFVKLGDGERACISGAPGSNCDGQAYSPELAQALSDSYGFLSGKVHVVDFHNQKPFNMLLHRVDNDLTKVKSVWDEISVRTGIKVFIGPSRLKPAAEFLKSFFIEVPLVNSFSELDQIKKKCFNYCKRDAVFVFSAGMISKIIIAELLKVRPDITCIDAGSAFDPIFVGQTRTFQAKKDELDRLYFSQKVEDNQPHVTICIPTLGREEKLKRLLELIPQTAEYPNYDVIVEKDSFENRIGVPKLLKKMVSVAKGEFIVFLGNDCVPKPGWLRIAMQAMHNFPAMDGLIGLNDGYWHGEFSPHWLASKKLLSFLDGEFFHTGYQHCGCDNELTERCRQAGRFHWCKEAEVWHDHPMQPGNMSASDPIYELIYKSDIVHKDTELLKSRAEKLGFPYHSFYMRPVAAMV